MTEAEFMNQVIAFARLHRWRVAHFRPARTAQGWRTAVQGDGQGFPDLVLIRGKTIIAAELKSARGRLAKEQCDWLVSFANCGVTTFVWRPSDWAEIELVLGSER